MGEMISKKYSCSNEDCDAEDEVRRFTDLNPIFPLTVNCWKCGYGRNMKIQQMLQERVGMFPVTEATA